MLDLKEVKSQVVKTMYTRTHPILEQNWSKLNEGGEIEWMNKFKNLEGIINNRSNAGDKLNEPLAETERLYDAIKTTFLKERNPTSRKSKIGQLRRKSNIKLGRES